MDKDFFAPAEIAQNLGVSPHTVYRLIYAGKLKSHKVGNLQRVPQAALDEFLEENAFESKQGVIEYYYNERELFPTQYAGILRHWNQIFRAYKMDTNAMKAIDEGLLKPVEPGLERRFLVLHDAPEVFQAFSDSARLDPS